MCATGRCTEGVRYRVGVDDDRYHDDLTKHYDIAFRNACKTQDFFKTHEDCEVCSFIRMGVLMNREPRVLTTEEMVAVALLGFTLLCWEAMPHRHVLGLEVSNGQ